MRFRNTFLTSIFMLAMTSAFSQGFLRGKVIDEEFAEGLIGATIMVEGTTNGTVSDFNGDYSLKLDAGTYTIVFSSVSFTTVTVSDVEIVDGEVTTMDINMKTDVQELEAVVVTAEVVRDSEQAMLTVQKKSANVLDGISSQSFRKIGDSNLSGAIKRVTGVTVEGGKYVYVRGLGDRYTKTTLNGMDIPGLDPDKNSVQIDIFPTNVLDNVVVYKTFSPDLFGDFTGGIVDVVTKDFPEKKITNLSVGLSFSPGMNFNPDFLSSQGSGTDWLGFDNGFRALPFDKQTDIPSEVLRDPELERLTRSFHPNMAAKKMSAPINGSFAFTHGDQVNYSRFTVGYNAVLNYESSYIYYDRFVRNRYIRSSGADNFELFKDENRIAQQGQHNVLWSGLVSGSIKFDNHSLTIGLLHSQNGQSTDQTRVSTNYNQTGAVLSEDILTYTQRSVTNNFVIGKHNFDKFQLEWRNALNWSRVYDPDFRETKVSVTQGDTSLAVGDGAGINRFYRDLNEFNESFKLDISVPFGERSKIKFGGIGTWKERDFEIINYFFRQRGIGRVSADADWFLENEQIWTPETRTGTYVQGNFEPANTFNARQHVYAGYLMSEMYISPQLRTIFGVRMEQNNMFYTGQNILGDVVYENEKTLDEFNILPSVNLVYSVRDNMNIRGSYNRSLARPSFKEKSNAQIYDPISKTTFTGNIDLQQTDINNFDLRYEYFFGSGEIISISGFYKTFDGHIEMVAFPTDPDNVKPRNSGRSQVYGTEIEFRKSLGFLAPGLNNLQVGTNVSVVRSEVDIQSVIVNESGLTEYEVRERTLKEGETLSRTRAMAGQAPYMFNAFLNYSDQETGTNVNLSYNVQGETLSIVGFESATNVFQVPFHSLNLNAFREFGQGRNHRVTFGIDNILNSSQTLEYQAFKADNQIYQRYSPGMNFSLKYTYIFGRARVQ